MKFRTIYLIPDKLAQSSWWGPEVYLLGLCVVSLLSTNSFKGIISLVSQNFTIEVNVGDCRFLHATFSVCIRNVFKFMDHRSVILIIAYHSITVFPFL
jgi:hypothetical protein